jgi:hypothetical protein
MRGSFGFGSRAIEAAVAGRRQLLGKQFVRAMSTDAFNALGNLSGAI